MGTEEEKQEPMLTELGPEPIQSDTWDSHIMF